MNTMFSSKLNTILGTVTLFALFLMSTGLPFSASAAALTAYTDSMSSSKSGVVSQHVIKFTTPTGVALNGVFTVNFPTFNLTGKTFTGTTMTYGVNGNETSAVVAATPGAANQWGFSFVGTVLTVTGPSAGTAILPTNKVILTLTSANMVNPAVSTPTIGIAGAFGDTGSTTVVIIPDDQVQVSAVVPQSLSFSLSDNTIGFGTITAGTSRFATGDTVGGIAEVEAHNMIVGTNAPSGYTLKVAGTTLTSGGYTINAIGSVNTVPNTTIEQFGIRATATGGTGTVSAPYAAAGYAFDTATTPTVASAAGTSANTTYSVRYLANIDAQTEAGAYTTALTYIATANF